MFTTAALLGFGRILEYSLAVRRFFYVCLAVAIALCSMTPRALHVHVSMGHSHHEHEHGPASHEHRNHSHRPSADVPRLSSCDPAAHAVFLNNKTLALSATATYVTAVVSTDQFALAPPTARYLNRRVIEPRQHSPPDSAPALPRPPPLSQA
jgi:hypothetical protein